MVGSKIIDQAMGVISKGELTKVTTTWRQAHFGAVMSGSVQLPHPSPNRTGVEKEVVTSSPGVDTVEMKEFCLGDVHVQVYTSWRVTIPPFSTVSIHSSTIVRDTVCRFTCWQSQHLASSCLHQWCQL